MNPARAHIALVEDTPALLGMYRAALMQDGYDVAAIASGGEALTFFEASGADLLVIDLRLPDMDGIAVLDALRRRGLRIPAIVMTGYASISSAVEAMRHGACDFLVKPFTLERLRGAVRTELARLAGSGKAGALAGLAGNQPAAAPAPPSLDYGGFIGTSPAMQKVYEQIEAAAKSNAAVFISGESGTGKEVCAQTVHKLGARAGKPFIPINCAAIPRELMESELFGHVKGAFTGAIADRDGAARLADGGTLFLDEIAEMTPDMQTKLLRFLQDYSFQKVGGSKPEKTDARIVCATNRDPLAEIAAGRFREDLFYRLHVLPITMPALRERGADVTDIAQTLLLRYTAEEGKRFEAFSEESEDLMRAYRWPGNIRQLQNVIRNIVVMHDARMVTAAMLPPALLHETGRQKSPPPAVASSLAATPKVLRPLAVIEREAIEQAISLCGGNVPQAAAALGISPSTIYRKKLAWEGNKTA